MLNIKLISSLVELFKKYFASQYARNYLNDPICGSSKKYFLNDTLEITEKRKGKEYVKREKKLKIECLLKAVKIYHICIFYL